MKGQVFAILNKITPQNFKDLSVKIIALGFDDLEKLEIAVEIVFDKAVLEPAFSQTYANLCKVMSSIQFPDDPNPKVSPFLKTLLNRCEEEFLKEKSGELEINKKIAALTEVERKRKVEEFQYLRTTRKKKMLGNINFIGELYNLSMISTNIIMESYIQYLLLKSRDEESIECLSKLFGTVGQKLELECSEVTAQSDIFEKIFVMFKQVNCHIGSRILIHLQKL
jgi:translation initiation factor 4G